MHEEIYEEECNELIIEMTHHSRERINQRVNRHKKRPHNELAELAYHNGIPIESTHGSLYRWLDKRRFKYPNTLIRIYSDNVYIFKDSDNPVLITVFKVPNKYKSDVKKLQRKKRRNLLG